MRTPLVFLLSFAASLLLVACVPQSPPVSPLPEIRDSPLMGQWRVESVTMDGESTDLRSYSPTFLTFTQSGTVETVEYCNHASRPIYYDEGGRFRLGIGNSTAQGCSTIYAVDGSTIQCSAFAPAGLSEEECREAGVRLLNLPAAALERSTQYVVSGDQLLLLGDGVWMELRRDEAVMPWYLLSNWEVDTVTRDGETVDYTLAGPIYITFQPDGYLVVYDKCPVAAYPYRFGSSTEFTLDGLLATPGACDHGVSAFTPASKCIGLVGMDGAFGKCLEVYEGMLKDLVTALESTNHVASESGATFYLRGDDVEVHLIPGSIYLHYRGGGYYDEYAPN